ncbi:DUF2164 domain-containing protein [Thalassotalea piscium]|uniref:Uncharacterized protein (DUF2164 family) n=1 Tax=Thalassotalea piscium TaxID=1230533 RepID=A0A7X0TT53_9GAMM|nr:DUF2164 domain-containing protein [Thalassotalea piscium]MBB6542730.1 uncharacterized protein (DUF2164 family) [Thalassotalea piscium]
MDFSPEKKEELITKLQHYFSRELDLELAQFDADFLLDFICKELGGHFYNQGLYDTQALLSQRLEVITDDLFQLEKPT